MRHAFAISIHHPDHPERRACSRKGVVEWHEVVILGEE